MRILRDRGLFAVNLIKFFSEVWTCARFEAAKSLANPKEWLASLAAPAFWCIIVVLVFGKGVMTGLPVAFVDEDDSSASRTVVQKLSAIPSIKPVYYDSVLQADEDLKAAKVYAKITIPKNFELESSSGRGSTVAFDFNKTYYPVGVIIEVDVRTAMAQIHMEDLVEQLASAGGGLAGNSDKLRLAVPEVYILGNQAFNFSAYLLPTFIPGLLALGAVLCFVNNLAREWRDGGFSRMHAACGAPSSSAFFIGKLLPWFAVFSLFGAAWVCGFAFIAGWGSAGSALVWWFSFELLLLAMAGLALLCAALSPTWVVAAAGAICLTAPTFPFTGFSFPLESMSPGARLFGELLPLTSYINAQAAVWILDSPADHIAALLGRQALFPIVLFSASLPLLSARLPKWIEQDEAAARLNQAREAAPELASDASAGFFEAFKKTICGAVFSRDTFVIFVGAVAFYLVFYAWPYMNQQISKVSVGIVNLDDGRAGDSLIPLLDSTQYIDVAFVERDLGRGLDAFKRQKADVLITIPDNYTLAPASGLNSTLHVLVNGAFPTKGRAVQSAVASVVADAEIRLSESSLRNHNIDGMVLKRQTVLAPSAVYTNRFNEIAGYGTYIVPMVGTIILQAVMLMGITVSLGGWLKNSAATPFIESALRRPLCAGLGVFAAYWTIAFFWFLYMHGIDFAMMEFGSLASPGAAILLGALFCAAVCAFGMAIALFFGTNSYTTPFVVIMSAPAILVSGAIWPVEGIDSPIALAVSQLLPSTPGIIGIAAASQDGASFADASFYALHLLLLTVFYLCICFLCALRLQNNKRRAALSIDAVY